MKLRSNPFAASSFALLITVVGITASQAADQYWNPSPLTDNWANPVWSATSGGGSLGTWTAANDAFFDQAGPYTVTLNTAQTAGIVNISNTAVTFAGSNGVSANTINIANGASLIGAGNNFIKGGTTVLNANGTLNFTTGAGGSRLVSLNGSSTGRVISSGGIRQTGTSSFAGNILDANFGVSRAALVWNNGVGGTLTLSGDNSGMSGDILLATNNAVLKLGSANAVGANSHLRLEASGGSVGQVDLAFGDFTRAFNATSNTTGGGGLNWSAASPTSGFYATGADRNFTYVNTAGGATSANVTWGINGLGSNTVTFGAVAGTHKITWTNNIDLAGATRTINTGDGSAAIDAELSGVISGTGATPANSALTKTGTGTLALTGANTYVGNTTISGGKLVINGSISTSVLTTVSSGATIGGNGTVGALTVSSGAFVTPGNSPGILTVNGNYTQAGTYSAEIAGIAAGSGYDQIDVTGSVDITGGSLVTLFSGAGYNVGDMLFILLNDGTDANTGTYTGLAQGASVANYGGLDWVISYSANGNSVGSPSFTGGNDIALMAIPEPNVAALLGGLGMLALLRRRRNANEK